MESIKKPSLSSRLLSSPSSLILGSGKKSSTMGELLRSSVPAWVEHLKDCGLTDEQETRLKSAASDCALCKCSLKGLKDLEPQNKKVCRMCSAVMCRQCTAQVHVKGHLRRRYVCFRCVGEAAVHTGLVEPKIDVQVVVKEGEVVAVTAVTEQQQQVEEEKEAIPQAVQQEEDSEEEDEGVVATFVTRLWDTWSGWTAGMSAGGGDSPTSADGGAAPRLRKSRGSLDLVEEETVMESPGQHAVAAAGGRPASPTALELSGAQQMDNVHTMLAHSDKFSGDVLQRLMQTAHLVDDRQVLCVPFIEACREIVKLMAGLGKAFEFAGGDMNDKLRIMDRRCGDTCAELGSALGQVTLQHMVEREIQAKTTHAGKKAAGATRTVVRLLWFLDFIAVLLTKLSAADNATVSLVATIGATYDETLAPRHVWVLRRVVKSGLSLVPDKKVFLERMGVHQLEEHEQLAKFKSWAGTLDSVRGDLWAYMASKGLTEIP